MNDFVSGKEDAVTGAPLNNIFDGFLFDAGAAGPRDELVSIGYQITLVGQVAWAVVAGTVEPTETMRHHAKPVVSIGS